MTSCSSWLDTFPPLRRLPAALQADLAAGESCTLTTACLVGEEEYQADGVAETAVRAVAVPRRLFDAMIADSGEFRRFVFAAFGRRVTSLMRVIEDVAFAHIEVRLAQRLLLLDDGAGRIAATHQELANELGSAREVVSRQLTEWQRRGLIRSQRGVVEIADRAAVARLASVT